MPVVLIRSCGDPCTTCPTVFACGATGGGVMVDESSPYEGGEPGNAGTIGPGSPGTFISESDVLIYDNNQDDPDGTLGTVPLLFEKPNITQTQQNLAGPGSPLPAPVPGCSIPSGFNWSTHYGPVPPAPTSFANWARNPGTYPEAQLSTNFTAAELTIDAAVSNYSFTTSTTQASGFSQEAILENLCYHAVNILAPMISDSNVPSFIVTSAFRNKTGGSQHNKGQATDLQFTSLHGTSTTAQDYYDLAQYIRDNFNYDQLILEWFGRNPWIHISTNSSGNRNNVLTQVGRNSYAPGLRLLTA